MKPEKLKLLLDIFKKQFPNEKPIAYWDKGDYIVVQIEDDGSYGCNYYVVKGSNIYGTNPMHEDLELKNRKKL